MAGGPFEKGCAPGPGRTPDYRDTFPEQARKLCLLGAIDKDLAAFFDVTVGTIQEWKISHPEFLMALDAGKEQADAEVAERLFERARGYEHKAVKIFMPAGATEPVYAEYTERYPPDTAAASLWLRNRQPKRWRDRQEVTGPNGGPIATEIVYRWATDKAEPAKE